MRRSSAVTSMREMRRVICFGVSGPGTIPKLSATLWPLVAFVARAGAYQAVPEMFQAALNHTVAKELDAELRTGLSETFADMERYHAARREVNEAKAAQLLGQRLQSNSHIDAATDDARPAKGNG